ncbi:MAG TPA: tRNA-dihydrouridine synthase [Phycisphaerae bacterium]|nr:tRNA-dihydrouridine synthase [Phycisphaerales bacterium]HRX83818.1 tRNA-dihydrouridine synthase [Phycisphaerae bacterium]
MLQLGTVEIAHPFVQAALSGYSDPPMRAIARRHGAAYTLNEVVLDKLVITRGKGQKRVLRPVEPDDHPVGGQLMGANPDDFGPAARLLADAGYDVIDINFGCPVRKVLGRCRGGFLLSQPEAALEIVARVMDAVGADRPVTVKMRRGLDDSAESERNFFAILNGAFALGVCAITVHGRTVEQRYVGPSRWAFLKRVKAHAGDRVILGSGDLFSAPACLDMMAETGVDGVTIARGAIGNPWIFRDCLALAAGEPLPEPPSIVEQGATIAAHFAESVRCHGADRAGALMRKFGIKYSELHPCARAVRDAFIAMRTTDDFQGLIDAWYNPAGDYPPVTRRTSHGDLIAAGATL